MLYPGRFILIESVQKSPLISDIEKNFIPKFLDMLISNLKVKIMMQISNSAQEKER